MYRLFICFFFTLFSKNILAQSIDTSLQLQVVEVKASHLQSVQTGKKRTTFDAFQKLTVSTQNLGEALNLNTPIFIKNYGPGRLATTAIRGAQC